MMKSLKRELIFCKLVLVVPVSPKCCGAQAQALVQLRSERSSYEDGNFERSEKYNIFLHNRKER